MSSGTTALAPQPIVQLSTSATLKGRAEWPSRSAPLKLEPRGRCSFGHPGFIQMALERRDPHRLKGHRDIDFPTTAVAKSERAEVVPASPLLQTLLLLDQVHRLLPALPPALLLLILLVLLLLHVLLVLLMLLLHSPSSFNRPKP